MSLPATYSRKRVDKNQPAPRPGAWSGPTKPRSEGG